MIKIKFPWWNGYKMSSLLFFIKTLLRSSEIFLPAWYETQWCKNFNFPDFFLTLKFLSLAIFLSVSLVEQDQHYIARCYDDEWNPAKSFQNVAISIGDSLPYFTKMTVVFFHFIIERRRILRATLSPPLMSLCWSQPQDVLYNARQC